MVYLNNDFGEIQLPIESYRKHENKEVKQNRGEKVIMYYWDVVMVFQQTSSKLYHGPNQKSCIT